MPDTVVGLFRTRSGAEEALGKLKEAGFGQDQLSVSTPAARRRGRYGLKVGSGIVIGTLVGALAGAVVTGMVPGVHPLIAGNVLATFLFAAVAGAATGGVAGGLLSMAAPLVVWGLVDWSAGLSTALILGSLWMLGWAVRGWGSHQRGQ